MDSSGLPDAPWPDFHPVQSLQPSAPAIADVFAATQAAARAVAWDVPAGAAVAIGVGSRGISNYSDMVRAVVGVLKDRGAKPFIVPAMGSHGGATAEAQRHVLEKSDITEQGVGAPVISSMDTVHVGTTPSGIEVFMDRRAYEAGRVILINRVKQHTSFVACVESGLMKMMSIGLGKLDGAKQYHSAAMRIGFETALLEMGRLLLAGGKITGGLACIENDCHQTAGVFATTAARMETDEREWLARARKIHPHLPFDELDLLIVDEMGKDISGTGMDPRVIGRSMHPEPDHAGSIGDLKGHTRCRRIFVRDLTAAGEGNATGVGLADVIHERLFRKINYDVTYTNMGTSLSYYGAKVPIWFSSDRQCIEFCLKNLGQLPADKLRAVRIRNTLALGEFMVSPACARMLEGNKAYKVNPAVRMEL